MAKIETFTRTNLATVAADIDKALAEISAKYGIEVRRGNSRFTGTDFTTKIEGKAKGTAANDVFASQMDAMGLVANQKNAAGETLIEMNTRRPKYPFTYTDKNGARFKTTLTSAKLKFGKTYFKAAA